MVGVPGTVRVVVPVPLAVAAGIAALVLPGFVVLVFGFFAWVAQIDARLPPLAAIRRSIDEVRGRFLATSGIVAATIAAILVFVLLSGILLAVVMNPDIAFEVDQYDEDTALSVILRGTARLLEEDEEHRAENVPLRPWVPTLKYNVVEIRPTELSGRRFALARPWLHLTPDA